jgi:glycerol-3-phosphate dehydrogenase (NAD(P)+)
MKITVLGCGAWGTALARLLTERRHQITLWGNVPTQLADIERTGRNELCLPGIELPRGWNFEPDLNKAVRDCDTVVVAVPSRPFREVTRCLAHFGGTAISVTKGIEYETGLTMCGVLRENAPQAHVAALSGPSLALEVARGIPTAIVAASTDAETAGRVQDLFHRSTFRVYTSSDVVGVELGGALKNVIAIAAGVCDGLGFGDNSKAALITRAIVEIRRLGVACGAQSETFAGLSGLGDLTVTCFSRLSRNRGLGERLGRGERLPEILASMVAVAEGYPTAKPAYELARKHHVSTPIIDEVHAMLYLGKNVAQALQDLIGRDSKPEDAGVEEVSRPRRQSRERLVPDGSI